LVCSLLVSKINLRAMLKSTRYFIILFIFFTGLKTEAQVVYKFSSRIDKFPKELNEFMSKNIDKDRKKSLKAFMLEFETFWTSDTLSQDQKKGIIKDANIMSAKRMRPYPDFDLYIKTIISLGRSKSAMVQFDVWMESLDPLMKAKSRSDFHKYLTKSTELFTHKFLYSSPTVRWEVNKLDFQIKSDGKHPKFIFNTIDMRCYTRRDTGVIFQTQGELDIITGRWKGIGGRIDWRRAKLDTAKVYALLRDYSMRLNSSKFFADSVTFYDHRRFGFAIPGYLSENILSSPPKQAIFPTFISYRKDLEIKDIFLNVDYHGGYSLKGAKIIGSGDKNQKAYFIFKRKGKRLVWAGAESFNIEPGRIISQRVNIIIYLDGDSIYHPGLSLSFNESKKLLNIYRMEKGLSMAPFYDSYHQLDLYTEAMFWNMDEDYIDLKMIQEAGNISSAYFESLNFFSAARYDRIKGLDRINPIYALHKFTTDQGFDEFYVEDFAAFMRLGKDGVKAMLMRLATQGFLIYDVNEDYCIVKERVHTYVMADKGRVDYDVIRFNSSVRGIPNASINLLNNDLLIQGVRSVFLSDSQKVYIYPKNQRVVVKKNRDFTFDGKIKAGRFDLYAKECYFNYDEFKLDLPIIDSLSFKVVAFEENKWGERPQIRVKTVIEDFKGEILVDDPDNKSGRKDFPEYPVLTSKTHSFVYYNKKSIFNGVYPKDKFYYRLESFTIDSLDNFETEGLEFKGYLASAGIFPDIDEPLKVQKDYSLGFETETGPAGFNIYGNKGKYVSKISISNQGLRGDGELKYLTSVSKSTDFVFFPDSTIATLDSYVINERKSGVEYPSVNAENVKMQWQPYRDLMTVRNHKPDYPIMMYKQEASLSGRLFLTPNDLTGDGSIAIKDAEMVADMYKFKNQYYNSDTCDFRLKKFVDESMGLGGLSDNNEDAYSTSNFKARIDFKERKGEFEANGGEKRVNFPENMYYCYMDQFVWYMDKDETEFSSTANRPADFDSMSEEDKIDVDIQGSEFVSTHPNQDSLSFVATRAIFNRRAARIHAFGVEYIRVADVAIIPDKKELKIFRKAEIEELTNAIIWANATAKYHRLYNGTININGRRSYTGRALYDYKDETGEISNIYFTNIYVDTTGTSIGEGEIAENAKFTLSPAFDFHGRSRLIANNDSLYFAGGTRIHYDCDTLERQWIYFAAFINPTNVQIPINKTINNVNNTDLFAGIYQNKRGSDIFHSFFDPVSSNNRNAIASATGVLAYDKITQEYRISTPDKLKQLTLPFDYVSLSKKDCIIRTEGKMDIGMNPGQVKLDAYGKGSYFISSDSVSAYVSIPLNFFFSDKALEVMVNDLNSQMDADGVNLDSRPFNIMLGQVFGNEEAEKLMTEITMQGGAFRKIPKELQSTLLISDVELKYNTRTRSWISTGQIGIASSGKTQINKYFDGIIEIENKGSYLEFRMVIDLGGGSYYFFDYNSSSGIMQVYSTNEEYVTIIKETKPDDMKMKSKEEGVTLKYRYVLGTPVGYKKFIRQMKLYN
jgi:hypothetical protein